MKKVFYPLACCCLAAGVFASCGGQKKANAQEEPSKVALSYSKSLKAPETDSLNLPVDENGYITIFDGETFNGWRGYGKDRVPSKWTIEDGCIKFNGSGGGEAQDGDGGDLIFAHKFKNFELENERLDIMYGKYIMTPETREADFKQELIIDRYGTIEYYKNELETHKAERENFPEVSHYYENERTWLEWTYEQLLIIATEQSSNK